MLKRVWDNAPRLLQKQCLATDIENERHCKQNQMYVQMTSKDCLTGTDRLYQVLQKS